MQATDAVPVARPPEPQPYASCRICGGEIGRTEQVAVFNRSRTVAHVDCYDAAWSTTELADKVGGP